MKGNLPLAVVVIVMLYLVNTIIIAGAFALFHILLYMIFSWKGVFVVALIMTIFQLLFCRLSKW